jgi:putative transposase
MLDSEATLEDRALAAWMRRRLLPRPAAKALLAATESLTLACLAALNRLRESGELASLVAENRRLRVEIAELRSENEILRSRIERIPPHERPHYSPEARFEIVLHRHRFLLSVDETARRFLVTPQTIYNWLRELKRNPDAHTIGSLLKPTPPIRRYGDVARRLARQMKRSGFEGCGQIAMTLARFGWAPSRSSVWRFCTERPSGRPGPDPPSQPPPLPRLTTVRGRHPNHLWLADITRVRLVFPFLYLHLAVVMDAYSRLPLQASLSYSEPEADDLLALVDKAIALHGKPRHFVSDQGSQFTAEVFRDALEKLGIQQRIGAVGEHGSIGLIDRFFRTLKQDLHVAKNSPRPRWPWSLADFERRLVPALVRYAYCRPHSALGGRVPVEAFFGIPDLGALTNLAPRGRPGDPSAECPFEVVFLDADHDTLPILVPKAA